MDAAGSAAASLAVGAECFASHGDVPKVMFPCVGHPVPSQLPVPPRCYSQLSFLRALQTAGKGQK